MLALHDKGFRKKEKTDVESAKDVDEVTINGDTPPPQNKELPRTPHHHGSFYLRIGAVGEFFIFVNIQALLKSIVN